MKILSFGEDIQFECDCGNYMTISCTDFGNHPYTVYCWRCEKLWQWYVIQRDWGFEVKYKEIARE